MVKKRRCAEENACQGNNHPTMPSSQIIGSPYIFHLRPLLLQLLFAISFGARYLLAQRWPSTSTELNLLSDGWIQRTLWHDIEHLFGWRLIMVILFFLFLISWSHQLKGSNDKRYSPTPLYLLHLFPISLLMGFSVNPAIAMITWLFINVVILHKFPENKKTLLLTLISASAMGYFEPVYLCSLPALLWSWRKEADQQNPLWLGFIAVLMLLTLGWNLPSSVHRNVAEQTSALSFLLGTSGIIALLILSMIGAYQYLRNEREQKISCHWILLLIPHLVLVVTHPIELQADYSLMICLLCLLALIHQVWLRYEKTAITVIVFIIIAIGNWGPASGLRQNWQERGQHQHQLRQLAETWSTVSEDKVNVLLCSDEHLLSLLRVHQLKPCFLYPPKGANTSFLHLGSSGLLIRVGATGNIETPHLESCKPWKQLNVQRQGQNLPIRIDTFERLVLPF